ncbi:ABC transporter ATP-binding protein [Arthrobacter sp. B6]|uniref:ABC transporter ATP-binding protein n=1 Tax=Arthrobacter sp. B6 TaxID=1570137 RepID=UPI00082A2DFB|nr:dipeptide/oligopeptide/nickel ABC transporter ATP-binding protein [Arthrobacter sp. B6]
MTGALLASGVSFAYPRRSVRGPQPPQVLRNVTLQVSAGESVALVGSSGSGKSTLLRIMLALARPSAGTVTLGGQAVVPGRASGLRWYRRAVQYIPQNPGGSLDPRMRVSQLLAEPLRQLAVPGDHKKLIRQVLERVEVPAELLECRPGELSGGQNQRVAIARALVVSPKFLLADEPVSGLDLPLRNAVVSLLDSLVHREGLGLVLVTHDLSTATGMCGRTSVLSEGEVVEHGATPQVLAHPAHQATAALLQASAASIGA